MPSPPVEEVGILLSNRDKSLSNVGTELDGETAAMKLLSQMLCQYGVLDGDSDFKKI